MILIRRRRRSSLALAAAAIVVTGCGDASSDATTAADETAGRVVATTTIWADVASNVACGEPVASIIPPGADPHVYESSLRDRATLDEATLVVANGADLEGSLTDLLDTVAAGGTPVLAMADHVPLIDDHDGEEPHREHDGDDGRGDDGGDAHAHADGNPHIWLDPAGVAGALDAIAIALTDHGYPADEIEGCAARYHDELLALDAELGELVDALPPEDREVVTNHDELAYFAARYGLDVVGTVIASSGTLADSNAAHLEQLASTMLELEVPAIFTDSAESSVDAAAVADRVGADLVPITAASLTDEPPADSYIGMLRAMTIAITEALGP